MTAVISVFMSILPELIIDMGFPWGSVIKESSCQCTELKESPVQFLGQEYPLEKETATHSGIVAWRIPGTEKPSRLQFTASQRVGHDWAGMHTIYIITDINRKSYKHICLYTYIVSMCVCVIFTFFERETTVSSWEKRRRYTCRQAKKWMRRLFQYVILIRVALSPIFCWKALPLINFVITDTRVFQNLPPPYPQPNTYA